MVSIDTARFQRRLTKLYEGWRVSAGDQGLGKHAGCL